MKNLTIFNAYMAAKKELKSVGIETFGFEAREIIKHVTGYDNATIMAKYSETLTPIQQTMFNDVLRRRKERYPLQYLLGEWSFYGLPFYVGQGVLVPRADTETLVDFALEKLGDKEAQVLDLCSGSGCIAIAVAKNSNAEVSAVEKYDVPFSYLEKNIKRNRANVTAIKSDLFSYAPNTKFDLILSNPPYISADEMALIDEETSHEPDEALYGGEDGLMFYRYIASEYKKHIKTGGTLAFEVGFSQSAAVQEILRVTGYKNIGTRKDINSHERVVFGTVEAI